MSRPVELRRASGPSPLPKSARSACGTRTDDRRGSTTAACLVFAVSLFRFDGAQYVEEQRITEKRGMQRAKLGILEDIFESRRSSARPPRRRRRMSVDSFERLRERELRAVSHPFRNC